MTTSTCFTLPSGETIFPSVLKVAQSYFENTLDGYHRALDFAFKSKRSMFGIVPRNDPYTPSEIECMTKDEVNVRGSEKKMQEDELYKLKAEKVKTHHQTTCNCAGCPYKYRENNDLSHQGDYDIDIGNSYKAEVIGEQIRSIHDSHLEIN